MDNEESPLDVLSRAATMVSPPAYDEARHSSKDMPTTRWRRERRQAANNKIIEGPLDFSTRPSAVRPPPSYDQSMQNKMTRPSVIQSVCAAGATTPGATVVNNNNNSTSTTPPQSDSNSDAACDPAIDEHFRRSLGKEYSSIFSRDTLESSKPENADSDSTGLSVDDHFAKALGDTWIKLKEKENQDKVNSAIKNNNNHLGNVKSQNDVSTKKKKKKNAKESMINDKRRAVVTST